MDNRTQIENQEKESSEVINKERNRKSNVEDYFKSILGDSEEESEDGEYQENNKEASTNSQNAVDNYFKSILGDSEEESEDGDYKETIVYEQEIERGRSQLNNIETENNNDTKDKENRDYIHNMVESYEGLLNNIHPYKNVVEGLSGHLRDSTKMQCITHFSTRLLFHGISNIYDLSTEEIQENLNTIKSLEL